MMCSFATLHFVSATVRLTLHREPLRSCHEAEIIVCCDVSDIHDPQRDCDANIVATICSLAKRPAD